jgi:hypothetical protein
MTPRIQGGRPGPKGAHGQIDLEGHETVDPRIEAAAKALWWRSAKVTWGRDGADIAKEQAERLWPRMRPHYMAEAEVALRAAGVL